jgi:hypothetical protein
MTTCTELPHVRSYGAARTTIAYQSSASSEGAWLSDQTDESVLAAKEALTTTMETASAESLAWRRRGVVARPKYAELQESDLEVDSPRAWEAKTARFQANGFARHRDPRRRQ